MKKILYFVHYLSVLIAIFALLFQIVSLAELNPKWIIVSLVILLLSLKIAGWTEKYK